MVCEVCGSTQMAPVVVDETELQECGLCGHLQGDAAAVEKIELRREAEERGFHRLVYPLVRALETVPTWRVSAASAGDLDTCEYPFVFLRLEPEGLQDLEHLLTSLEMANRNTVRRWVVECALQRGLLFIVRPRFWKAIQDIDRRDIEECRADLGHLAEAVRRDVRLSWWRG